MDMEKDTMNEFQRKCIEACRQVLKYKGVGSCSFEKVTGDREDYFLAEVSLGDNLYKIYIYEDEAGFSRDKEWFICERPAYPTDDELVKRFCESLQEEIVKGSYSDK